MIGEQTLKGALFQALCKNHDQKLFLPEDKFSSLITRDQIGDILRDPSLSDWTYTKARRTFAILVFMLKAVAAIGQCREVGFDDDCLPFSETSTRPGIEKIKKIWNDAIQNEFCDVQWKLLAPVLKVDGLSTICSGALMPFITKKLEKPSGFGDLFKCDIHPAHLLVEVP